MFTSPDNGIGNQSFLRKSRASLKKTLKGLKIEKIWSPKFYTEST